MGKVSGPSTHFSSSWLGGISIARYSLSGREWSAARRAWFLPQPGLQPGCIQAAPQGPTPPPGPLQSTMDPSTSSHHVTERATVSRQNPQEGCSRSQSQVSSPPQPWPGRSHLGDLTSSVFSAPLEPWHNRYWRSCSERLSCGEEQGVRGPQPTFQACPCNPVFSLASPSAPVTHCPAPRPATGPSRLPEQGTQGLCVWLQPHSFLPLRLHSPSAPVPRCCLMGNTDSNDKNNTEHSLGT